MLMICKYYKIFIVTCSYGSFSPDEDYISTPVSGVDHNNNNNNNNNRVFHEI